MNWPYTYTPYIWPMLASAIIAVGVSIYSLHWRRKPGAVPLALTCFCAFMWALGCALEIAGVDTSTRIFWSAFQGPWKIATATAEFCFVLEYADPGRWLNRRTLALLGFPVLLVFLLTATNSAHHLVYWGFTDDAYPRPMPGIANALIIAYVFVVLSVLQLVILVWLAIRSPQHRVPVVLMLIGQVTVRAATFYDWISATPLTPMDVGLVVAAALYLLYAFILARFHLFDLVPVARATGIEQMDAGLVVLDTQRRIVDLNPAAERILSVTARPTRGRRVETVLVSSDLPALSDVPPTTRTEISLETGGDQRYYALHLSPLKDRRGVLLGHNILLHDITEYKRARELVDQQQRALAALHERERLARELHDSIGQVLGYVSIQVLAVRTLLKGRNLQEADEQLARLGNIAQDAHADVRDFILGLRSSPVHEQPFAATLRHYLEGFERNFGIHTEFAVAGELESWRSPPDTELQLFRIVQEALTNARRHAAAHCIRVTLASEDGQAHITIRDDGRGFDVQQAGLPDQAGGFGLQFMRERAEQVAGRVNIISRPGMGTQVELQVPLGSKGVSP